MNRAVEHLAARRVFLGAAEQEWILKAEREWRRGNYSQRVPPFGKVASLRGSKGVFLLVTPRKFQVGWFKVTLLGRGREGFETLIHLGIMSWFAAVGLKTSDSHTPLGPYH